MNILIVDDERDSCAVLEKFLSMKGHEARSANNGGDALKESDALRPDVIIMDIKMPGMDGLEVLSQIKRKQPDCFVIMLSAKDDEKTKKDAMLGGAAHFLSKPVKLAELLRLVESAPAGNA